MCVCVCVCVHACACECVCVCVCACMHMCMHTCMHMCVCACMCVRGRACMHAHLERVRASRNSNSKTLWASYKRGCNSLCPSLYLSQDCAVKVVCAVSLAQNIITKEEDNGLILTLSWTLTSHFAWIRSLTTSGFPWEATWIGQQSCCRQMVDRFTFCLFDTVHSLMVGSS